SMPERKNAAIAPDEIERERQQGIAQILAPQGDHRGGQMQWRGGWDGKIEQRHQHRHADQDGQEQAAAAGRSLEQPARDHASTARPFRANKPRGRFWMNRMTNTSSRILPSTAPA